MCFPRSNVVFLSTRWRHRLAFSPRWSRFQFSSALLSFYFSLCYHFKFSLMQRFILTLSMLGYLLFVQPQNYRDRPTYRGEILVKEINEGNRLFCNVRDRQRVTGRGR